MTKRFMTLALFFCGLMSAVAGNNYDFTKPIPRYSDEKGYGYDINESPSNKSNAPFYFSVKVPDGNYRVSVTIGSKKNRHRQSSGLRTAGCCSSRRRRRKESSLLIHLLLTNAALTMTADIKSCALKKGKKIISAGTTS